ncbi:MAG: homocysteine S-methyltransferase family protein [Syntrophaceae bacterium]|nr:homocysteine S-methyltransferase family protein [Syntrophaceae bacterium]
MDSIIKRLEKEVLVLSGAMGTMMAKMGADLGGCIGQWIVEHPDVYRDLVREYFRVGCDIVSGGTFNLNRITLAKFGLTEKAGELNRGMIRILKSVQPVGKYVAGSMGPMGRMLKPLGDVDPREAFEAFSEQARSLADGGAEIVIVLTMYDLEEAVIALRAVKKASSLPVFVSLAFNRGAQGYRTMMGVSPDAAARRLEAEGADIIGANCGSVTLKQMTEVIRLMKAHCRRPLMAKPNAGSPQVVEGKEQYAASPEEFAEHVEDWVKAGARIVSACCGSGPPHLNEIVKRVKKLRA